MLCFNVINDVNVVLEFLYKLLASTNKSRRLVLSISCVIDWTLANGGLRLAKHWQSWRPNWMLRTLSFTAVVLDLVRLPTYTEPFPWKRFLILALLACSFVCIARNLVHLLFLFLQIALLLFSKHWFVCDDRDVYWVLGRLLLCLWILRKHVAVLVMLGAHASGLALGLRRGRCSWYLLLIGFLEIVAE